MNRTIVWASLIAATTMTLALASSRDAVTTLKGGRYSAKVAAIPCGGCPPLIQKTMLQQEGIEMASADQKTSILTFQVKEGSAVKLVELQVALKAASDQMGMGADYGLQDVKKIK